MRTLSRRQATKLASSFVAAIPLLNGLRSRAQPAAGAGATILEMANFTQTSPDHDAAFAKAVAAISKAAAEAQDPKRTFAL